LALGPGTRRELLSLLRLLPHELPELPEFLSKDAALPGPWSPDVPVAGGGVLLGSWTSPAGWPWEIGVVRVRWVGRVAEHAIPDFPAFVMEPRPWPRITGRRSLSRAFRRYQDREPGQPPARSVRWKPDGDTPTRWTAQPGAATWAHPAEAWENSLDLMRRLDADASIWEGLSAKQTATLLTRLWRDTPWLFLLHPELQQRILTTLGLPPGLEATPCLAAAHASEAGAKGRKGAWPPGRLVARKPGFGHPEPIHAAYDWLLDRNEGKSREIIAFLEGQADAEGITTSAEDIPKKLSERLAELDDGFAVPTMLPLLEEALPALEPQEGETRDEVLAAWLSVRAPQALWLAFGKQAERVSVATEHGGSVQGLEAILEVQHRGHMVPLNKLPWRWDETWGWRWVVPGGMERAVDGSAEAPDGASQS